MRNLRIIAAAFGVAASLLAARPGLAAGVVIAANDGPYFTAFGPSAYWKLDWGRGFCGYISTGCRDNPPTNVRWTYVHKGMGSVNYARWTNREPVWYPEYAKAFIPSRNATAKVTYSLKYAGPNYHNATIDQLPYSNQWVALNSSGLMYVESVQLTDQTWWGTASDKVAFDEIKIEN